MRQRGFTLLEITVVIAIIAILATLAIGLGASAVRRQKFLYDARSVYNAMSLARMAALSEGRPGVVALPATGVTAFIDRSTPANYVFDIGVDKLLFHQTFESNIIVDATDFPNAPATATPTALYDSSGFSVKVDDTSQLLGGNVVLTDAELPSDNARRIETTIGGAMRIRVP